MQMNMIIPTIMLLLPLTVLFTVAGILLHFKQEMQSKRADHYDGDLIIGYSKTLGPIIFCDENIYAGLKSDIPYSQQSKKYLNLYQADIQRASRL